jgi:hypothetical protein
MGMPLPCRLFLHSYFSPSHLPHRWCSQHRPWCVDMLFRVVLDTLPCYFVWFLQCWHAAQSGLWHCIWHVGLWSFFWSLDTSIVLPGALGTQGRLGAMLRGIKKNLITFMFILFFWAMAFLTFYLMLLVHWTMQWERQGLWHFFSFIYLLG